MNKEMNELFSVTLEIKNIFLRIFGRLIVNTIILANSNWLLITNYTLQPFAGT